MIVQHGFMTGFYVPTTTDRRRLRSIGRYMHGLYEKHSRITGMEVFHLRISMRGSWKRISKIIYHIIRTGLAMQWPGCLGRKAGPVEGWSAKTHAWHSCPHLYRQHQFVLAFDPMGNLISYFQNQAYKYNGQDAWLEMQDQLKVDQQRPMPDIPVLTCTDSTSLF